MFEIEPKNPDGKRYPGLKAKLIHLKPATFQLLNAMAKAKGYTLKSYIETLCDAQAKFEAEKYMEIQKQMENEEE